MQDELRSLLMELAEFGRPRLARMEDGGWLASVEFPAPNGVNAAVRSDFKHATPEEALRCVHERLGGLRNMLSVPTPALAAEPKG